MSEISVKIGARIRYLRVLKEFSQEQLAFEAGLNPAFLGHLERGLKSPTVNTLQKVATALGISLSELVDIEENSETNEANEAIEKITLCMKNLTKEDAESVAHLVAEIVKFKRS